jgi:TonB family protein
MPILELFPNPSREPDQTQETTGDAAGTQANGAAGQPLKLRTNRYGELEEHQILLLLDSFDDERARARFRESIYISVIIYMAFAWFLFYGPRVLFHQPRYQDPIALMKQHDKELTFLTEHRAPVLKPPPRPVIDRKTMEQLQQQARLTAPAPQPLPQQPEEQAHLTAPPVPQPPLPIAPKPAQPAVESPLPAAPHPNFAQNPSAHDAIQNALRGALSRGGGDYGSSSGSHAPLQAGAEILSDTMGVDFSSYMRRLHDDIQRNWDPLIPEEVQPPLMKKGKVFIRFTILPGGQIGAMTLETPSGDVALDHAAWNAITSEGDFPPLPKQFHGPQLELRVGFFYNIPLPE